MAAKNSPAQDTPVKRPNKRLRWTPTPYVWAGLARIEKLGIFGADLSAIVNHLVGEELRRLLESNLLDRKELDQEVESLTRGGGESPFRADSDE